MHEPYSTHKKTLKNLLLQWIILGNSRRAKTHCIAHSMSSENKIEIHFLRWNHTLKKPSKFGNDSSANARENTDIEVTFMLGASKQIP